MFQGSNSAISSIGKKVSISFWALLRFLSNAKILVRAFSNIMST